MARPSFDSFNKNKTNMLTKKYFYFYFTTMKKKYL